MQTYKPKEIEVPQNLKIQYKSWIVQRVAWVIMFLIIVIAGLGFFGQGFISSKTIVSTSSSLNLQYERYLRNGSQEDMMLTYKCKGESDTIKVKFNNRYLENIKIESIHPQSISTTIGNNFTTYLFLKEKGTTQIKFIVHIEPYKAGTINSEIIVESDTLNFTQFIYP